MGKFSFSQEPAVWIGLLTAIIDAIAVFFPSTLTGEQKVTLVGVVTTLVPVVLSFVTRSQVSPVAKAPAPPVAVPGP
jgi:uncharacterized membrane protein